MSHPNIPLEQDRVIEPCAKTWETMEGDHRTRFCEQCSKHVHRTREMTRDEAETLLNGSNERVCAILEYDDAGQVLTLDYAPPRPARRNWFWPITAIGAAMTTLFSTLSCSPQSPPRLIMGDIAPVRAQLPGRIAPSTTPAAMPGMVSPNVAKPSTQP